MWNRILVPIDGSDPATSALEHALDIADDVEATVHVLYVANTNQPSLTRIGTEVVDALEREGGEIVSQSRERAEDRGVSVVDDIVQGDPEDVIVEYANSSGVDLVIMGAKERSGISGYFLESVTDHVVNASDVPVLTVRATDGATRSYPYDSILVPTDGSDHARAAVKLGSEVAERYDATLHLLFVLDELPETVDLQSTEITDERERRGRELLEEEAEFASRTGLEDVVMAIELGSVPGEIRSYAETAGVDLVVMGTHGRTGLDQYLLGSFTERVLRTAHAPVLTTTAVSE